MSSGSSSDTEREAPISSYQYLMTFGVLIGALLVMVELSGPKDKTLFALLTERSTTPNTDVAKNTSQSPTTTTGSTTDSSVATTEARAELERLRNEVHSERAIQDARRIAAKDKLRQAREHLEQLQSLESAWSVKWSGLLIDEAGRRVIASAPHDQELIALAKRSRPTESQIIVWQEQLATLAKPIEQVDSSGSQSAITSQHEQKLVDLGQQIADARAELKLQQTRLLALVSETANVAPGSVTLAEAIALHDRQIDDTRAKAIMEAQAQGEQKHVERIAQLKREEIEDKTKRVEDKASAEKESRDNIAKLELDKINAETRVQEAQRLAEIAQLDDVAGQAKKALAKAQLEREFARDLPMVQQYLMAFMADGYDLRPDRTKGPASLSTIEGLGGLEQTEKGLYTLYNKCFINKTRPKGAVVEPLRPDRLGSVEKCQGYLIKYGQLMVEKGLLAP